MLITQVIFMSSPTRGGAQSCATLENARNSVREPGIARFDFIQQVDDPTRFMLVEVFRDAEAPARHRESAHFQAWLAVAGDMVVEPRTRRNTPTFSPTTPAGTCRRAPPRLRRPGIPGDAVTDHFEPRRTLSHPTARVYKNRGVCD